MKTFQSLYMAQFRKKWRDQGALSLNATNPQSFTLKTLKALIGKDILDIDPEVLLEYGSDRGLFGLRCAINDALYPGLAPENIVTTAGGKEAIYVCMHALLEAGDEVVAFTPTFEPLIKIAHDIGCHIELIALDETANWALDLNELESKITDTTKMVIINFPHNPTGALIEQATLDQIVALCKKYNVWLFSDEVFRGLEHQPNLRVSPVAQIYEKGISIGVLSKSHGVPAIRVGWVASQNLAFLERILEVKSYLSICNGRLSEIMAIPIIEHSNEIFKKHRELLVNNLTILEGLKETHTHFNFHSPKGGCTVFASTNEGSEIFSEKLIQMKNLMVIPSPAFVTKVNAFRLGFSYFDYEARLLGVKEMLNSDAK